MRPEKQWWEKYRRLGLFHLGMKILDFLHAVLTGTGLSDRMNSAGPLTQRGVYPEKAFLYLLDSESRRSERSGHLCQILLVYRADAQGAVLPMEPAVARTVVAVLSRTLRDTDYVGWYRDGRVVGGVLTLLGRDSSVDGSVRLRTNLTAILQSELGQQNGYPVQVRVYPQNEVRTFELS